MYIFFLIGLIVYEIRQLATLHPMATLPIFPLSTCSIWGFYIKCFKELTFANWLLRVRELPTIAPSQYLNPHPQHESLPANINNQYKVLENILYCLIALIAYFGILVINSLTSILY